MPCEGVSISHISPAPQPRALLCRSASPPRHSRHLGADTAEAAEHPGSTAPILQSSPRLLLPAETTVTEAERPLQPIIRQRGRDRGRDKERERQRETERERSVSSVTDSLSDQTESYRLPVIFISGYLDMYVFINLSGAVCLSEVSVGSCWRSASCLHGNRIHEPQIAPPSRVSLRCGGAISNHITPLHISHPSTAPRRSC